MRKSLSMAMVLAVLGLVMARPAAGQSRPLVTEDPETVPAGFILLEAGLDFTQDTPFPTSGLEGALLKLGTFGFSFGISSIAEIQVDGGVRNRLNIDQRFIDAPLAELVDVEGDTTSDFHDLTIGAKVRVVSETLSRPAVAFRFFTRLPNSNNESGLGLDTMDFFVGLAMAKTIESVRVAGNVGLGILSDPIVANHQNDVLTYGISVARAVAQGVEVVGELNGRLNPRSSEDHIGTDSLAVARVGTRFTRGPVRLDGAFLVGVTERDPSWGLTAGLTWVFRGFTVQ